MSKRKRQPESFDVVEFLRESDDDLKSALNSLLRAPGQGPDAQPDSNLSLETNLIPEPKLVYATHPNLEPTNLGSGPNSDAPTKLVDPVISTSIPPTISGSGVNIHSDINLAPEELAPSTRRFAIREMRRYQDAHTRAEQHVYECLWENAKPHDAVSRAITIGFGALAKLVGLSESNARINLRSLTAKLAVEEIAEYDCERSLGRTYRIFTDAEIVRRRREAGLVWFMRRTLAVVFVDPSTGEPLLKRKPIAKQDRVLN